MIYLVGVCNHMFLALAFMSLLLVNVQFLRYLHFYICIANGRYHGGGYLQAPEADPTDGLLHVTIISEISKWGVIKNIKNLYDGSFTKDPAVSIEKGESFSIESTLPIDVEIDGELLPYPFREISIIPKAIGFVVP